MFGQAADLRHEARTAEVCGPMAESEDGVGFLGRGSMPPPHQLRGLGECCKLAQWGMGRSYGKCGCGAFSGLEKSISNLDI